MWQDHKKEKNLRYLANGYLDKILINLFQINCIKYVLS